MKILIIGTGSIGKRHLKNLINVGIDPSSITAIDTREDRREEVLSFGVKALYPSLDIALENDDYDAALICSPTNLHLEHGIKLASRGIHMMIEKPLAHDLKGSSKFTELVEENKVIVLMGYIFRFSPLTKKVKALLSANSIGKVLYVRGEFSEYLPDWHPYEDYRSFYMAEKAQGGGSILDQCHIMDLTHYLFGGFENVFALNDNLSNLEINADDYAEMVIKLKSGVLASIHTDIFGREHKKQLEIKGEKGNILWDFYANEVALYDAENKSKKVFNNFTTDFNLCYIDEIKHFIECCKGDAKPIASLQDGIDTMELILSAECSHLSNKLEKVRN